MFYINGVKNIYMHKIQEKIMNVVNSKNLSGMTLRAIGDLIGESSPQKIKHHLGQLAQRGAIKIDTKTKSMLPARLPNLSSRCTSAIDVHAVPSGKKNAAASVAMSHLSRKRIGQITARSSSSASMHTPSGFLALSLVQLGTLLL